MAHMIAYDRVKRAVLGTEDPTERKVRFMALLASSLPKIGRRPVLVGGSAIEVYLDGILRTGDMDVVYDVAALRRVLRGWRFDLGAGLRSWVNDELGLAVDMVGGELEGSYERVTTIITDYGPTTVIGVEDLVLKRLSSAKYWKAPTDLEQAFLLAKAHADRIDWKYLEEEAAKAGTLSLLRNLRKSLRDRRT
jgi:hypothetical protein